MTVFPSPGRVPRNVVWYLDNAAFVLEADVAASLRAVGKVVPLLPRSASGKLPTSQVRLAGAGASAWPDLRVGSRLPETDGAATGPGGGRGLDHRTEEHHAPQKDRRAYGL